MNLYQHPPWVLFCWQSFTRHREGREKAEKCIGEKAMRRDLKRPTDQPFRGVQGGGTPRRSPRGARSPRVSTLSSPIKRRLIKVYHAWSMRRDLEPPIDRPCRRVQGGSSTPLLPHGMAGIPTQNDHRPSAHPWAAPEHPLARTTPVIATADKYQLPPVSQDWPRNNPATRHSPRPADHPSH